MNLHMITHLVENVKYNGPLWSHSMFSFESSNGKLVKYAKGRREILHEIALKYILNLGHSETAKNSENRDTENYKTLTKKLLMLNLFSFLSIMIFQLEILVYSLQ